MRGSGAKRHQRKERKEEIVFTMTCSVQLDVTALQRDFELIISRRIK
jgi:hypothetical protein